MAGGERTTSLRSIRDLFGASPLAGLTDAQLLERFVDREDVASEAAFALLVEQHGRMVLRVCRSILSDPHAAEDAFQATFLLLAQKANSLRTRQTVGPWLYHVAVRVASCARSTASRRRKHEARAAETRVALTSDGPRENGSIVLAEVAALPERYRAVVVLCCLEGLTYREAAQQLGCPVGTVQSRLARGRERLRNRLTRRGLGPSVVLTGLSSAQTAFPRLLMNSTTQLASLSLVGRAGLAGAVAGGANLLRNQVEGEMIMARMKSSGVVCIAVSALVGAAVAFQASGVAKPAAPPPPAVAQAPEPVVRADPRGVGTKLIPNHLDFGPLRVGSSADAGAHFSIEQKQEWGDLAVRVTPPPFLKVRKLQIRERTRNDKRSRLVELVLAIDTSRRGDLAGQIRMEHGHERVDLPVSATILPPEANLTKVLVITPGFGDASSDSSYYRPWFDLVKAAHVDVSYLDPTVEGFPHEDPQGIDRHGVPEWLKPYDVVLIVDGGPVYLHENDIEMFQKYVRGGGRLVVGASRFMTESVPNANALLREFGLALTDEDITRGRGPGGRGWVPFVVKAVPGEEPLMKGVGSIAFHRASPVQATAGERGRILFGDGKVEGRGFAAVARDGGEVVALGASLFFGWLDEKEGDSSNIAFVRNLLSTPRRR